MAYFTKIINSNLDTQPLKVNGGLTKFVFRLYKSMESLHHQIISNNSIGYTIQINVFETGGFQLLTSSVLRMIEKQIHFPPNRFSTTRLTDSGGRLNKKDGLTRYGDSHVKDKTS